MASWNWFGEKKQKASKAEDLSPLAKDLARVSKLKDKWDRRDGLVKVAEDAARAGEHAVAIAALTELKASMPDMADLYIGNILDSRRDIFVRGKGWTAGAAHQYIQLIQEPSRRQYIWKFYILDSFARWGQLDDVKASIQLAGDIIEFADIGQFALPGLMKNNLYAGALECLLMRGDKEAAIGDFLYRLVTEHSKELKEQGVTVETMNRVLRILQTKYRLGRVFDAIREQWGATIQLG